MRIAQTIVIVRHAEKPPSVGAPFGVDETGEIDRDNLTVRGWQRAGALCQLLTAGRREFSIERPVALFAAATSPDSPSVRCWSTLKPLAEALELPIDDSFGKGSEAELARELDRHAGTVVIAWEHRMLPALARAIVGGPSPGVPRSWPDERFDVTWVIATDLSGMIRFEQHPQMLLGGDLPDPISHGSSCA